MLYALGEQRAQVQRSHRRRRAIRENRRGTSRCRSLWAILCLVDINMVALNNFLECLYSDRTSYCLRKYIGRRGVPSFTSIPFSQKNLSHFCVAYCVRPNWKRMIRAVI